jgi:hypothetical protein
MNKWLVLLDQMNDQTFTWDDLRYLNLVNVENPSSRAHPTLTPMLPQVAVSHELARYFDKRSPNKVLVDAVLKEAQSHSNNKSVALDPMIGELDYPDVSHIEMDQSGFIIILDAKDGVVVNQLAECDQAVIQKTLGYMGAAFRRHDRSPVFGILSNGLYWNFFSLDKEGVC